MTPPIIAKGDRAIFLKKFLRHGTKIASVTPSSRTMSKAMVKGLKYREGGCIVELGAGTGPITAELVKENAGRSALVIIERDPDFCRILREKFPDQDIVEGDASDVEKILAERGITHVDHIVCGLGVPAFPSPAREELLAAMGRILAPGATLHQLTEFPLVFLPFYKKFFNDVEFRFVLRNVPPAGLYVCRDPKIV